MVGRVCVAGGVVLFFVTAGDVVAGGVVFFFFFVVARWVVPGVRLAGGDAFFLGFAVFALGLSTLGLGAESCLTVDFFFSAASRIRRSTRALARCAISASCQAGNSEVADEAD